MKRITKILCLILTVALLLPFCVSCNKGEIVAVYDGNPVYESDVADIINYTLINAYDEYLTDEDIAYLMRDAVQTYVRYLAMEIDMKEMGYTIDEKALKESIAETKEELEKEFGYKEWRESYRVSKDFLAEELRRYYIAELYNNMIKTELKVTTEEAKAYYQVHAIDKYAVHAGYTWTALLRPVRDITDETENAEAKAEMDLYLEKINNGTLTWDQVKSELDTKYNKLTGYPNAIYAGEDFTSVDAMITIQDEAQLQEFLKEIDEAHSKRDPKADEKSEEYAAYMNYLGNSFQARLYYALQNMEKGEVWNTTFESFVGYYIIRLDRVEVTNEFIPFESVLGEITDILLAEKLEAEFVEYFESLDEAYDITYIFDLTPIS